MEEKWRDRQEYGGKSRIQSRNGGFIAEQMS